MKYLCVFILLLFSSFTFCQEDNNEYYSVQIKTGDKPECITCKSFYNYKLDNFLRIDATGSTDVVIKVIKNYTDECIRTVYISGGSIFDIKNIPEGVYYLKIAYGYDWSKKVIGSFCFAKFTRDVHYQIGNDILDFNIKNYSDGYQVPSFELVLKVLSNSRKNEFDSDNISEEEFYK